MALRGPIRGRRRRKMMLITGGSGFLGRHLANGHASDKWEFIAPSSRSLDVRNRTSTIDTVRDWRPSAVVHLAYRKGDRPGIVDGSRNMAEAAAAAGARMVHMSTDAVFPGQLAKYNENDDPAPVTDYGRDKLEAEIAVMTECPSAVTIRTSLLYGTGTLSVPQLDVQRALSTGSDYQPMKFFTDEYRCPAHVDDVAVAIAELASRTDVRGPLHVAGPDLLSRAEFANVLARWFGLDPSGLQTATHEDIAEVRPTRIHLDSSKAESIGIKLRPIAATLR